MKYIYFLFIIIILYLIYNYYLNCNENFDSSLIPVSSLVTLSTFSQNLLKNNTLTHPGNLQIGINSAPGDLTVTGNTTVTDISSYGTSGVPSNMQINGQTTFNGNNTLNGDQTITDHQNIKGNSIVNNAINATGDINVRTSDNNTRIGRMWTSPGIYAEGTKNLEFGSGTSNVYIGSGPGAPSSASNNIIVTGNMNVLGTSQINADSSFNGTTNIGNLSISKGINSPDKAFLAFGDNTGWRTRFINSESTPVMDITDNGNLYLNGPLTAKHPTTGVEIKDITDDIYNQIHIYYSYYKSPWKGEGNSESFNSLTNLAKKANNERTYKFEYKPGTLINEKGENVGGYDAHYSFRKSLDVIYTCGINGLRKSANVNVDEYDTFRLDCTT